MAWNQPQLVIEIRSLLGLVRHYRRIIEGFAKIVASLIQLTKKNQLYAWIEIKQVAAYASRKLKVHEKDYPTHNMELAAIANEMDVVIKDFEFTSHYHPMKANMVDDSLSRKRVHHLFVILKGLELLENFHDLDPNLDSS
ncbi:uncharacterized protein [Cicer arietinum]|uniref:Uncharacterized protein LOC101490967 n=1 Tax=Cicer arietinum TaxID=3827 RepID=A0A1S2YM41_CICAR|nr:uncharacterized protein LOC101490967 [Cicer arietinum]